MWWSGYVWVERVGFTFNYFRDQGFTFFSRYHSGIFNLMTITCHFLHSRGKFAYFFFLFFITQVKPFIPAQLNSRHLQLFIPAQLHSKQVQLFIPAQLNSKHLQLFIPAQLHSKQVQLFHTCTAK